jgi:hypothetical protein
MALEKNLELRISSYSPQFALYNLNAAKAGYQPTLSLSGQHNHDESGKQLLSGGFSIPGADTDSDRFSGNLSGLTPWGMTYGLRASASESTGDNFVIVSNNAVPVPF